MGWADCGTDSKGRPIGYGHEAVCDHEGCKAEIDRGLAHACGGMHGPGNFYDSGFGCEQYFCGKHLLSAEINGHAVQLCPACQEEWEASDSNPERAELDELADRRAEGEGK